jgi:3'(2'), 5'-bisphosphate nucleotidase
MTAIAPDRQALAHPVLDLSRRAGDAILEVYRRDFDVETKADDSPLTAADRAAHALLAQGLRELAPDLPVLSEEGGLPPLSERDRWGSYWLVDPLDGTREFVKRNGEFTVNIALMQDRRPVLGVVHAPVLERSWVGVRDVGAFRYEGDERTAIRTRAVPADAPMTVVVSRSHRGEAVDRLLQRLPAHDTVSVGSSLKFCLVAEGRADLYPRLGPTSEWDTAAAECVVESAGGRVSRVDLTPISYNSAESLLNPDFVVIGDPAFDWATPLQGLPLNER